MSERGEFISFEFYMFKKKRDKCRLEFIHDIEKHQTVYSCSCPGFDKRLYCQHLEYVLSSKATLATKLIDESLDDIEKVKEWFRYTKLMDKIQKVNEIRLEMGNLKLEMGGSNLLNNDEQNYRLYKSRKKSLRAKLKEEERKARKYSIPALRENFAEAFE